MDVRATAKIKIETRPEIVRTIDIYKKGLQLCIDKAWKSNVCGHQVNSDLMASINIAGRYILSSRADVNLPIFSSDDSLLRVCHSEHDVCDEVREKPYPLG